MEVRIRENDEGFYAESGDEVTAFHQCPTRATVEAAKQDAVREYGIKADGWQEPQAVDYAPDIVAVA